MVTDRFRHKVELAIRDSGLTLTPTYLARGEREAAFLPEVAMAFVSFRGGQPDLIPAATAAGLMDSYPDGKPKQTFGEAVKESGRASLIWGAIVSLLILAAAYLARL